MKLFPDTIHISKIPSFEHYNDRVSMFLEIGKSFKEQYLHIQCSRKENYDEILNNSNVFLDDKSNNRYKKFISLWNFLTFSKKCNKIIIHDLFSPSLSLIDEAQILKKSKKTKHLISFYYPNTKFYKEKSWENLYYPLSLEEKNYYKRMFKWRSFTEYIATKFADGIVCNSKEICDSIINYYKYPPERIKAIPTAIDVNKYKRVLHAKERLNGFLKNNDKLILYVGSIQPRKEVEFLIEVAGILKSKYKNIKIAICGSFHTRRHDSIKTLISKYKLSQEVLFTGFLSTKELSVFYSASDCFFFPSRWEGSPRVMKEAMAYGCPVVATDISGNRIIDPEGKWIRFFSPGNKEEATGKILQVLDDLHNSEKQITYIRENFSPIRIAQLTVEFYNQIISYDIPYTYKQESFQKC